MPDPTEQKLIGAPGTGADRKPAGASQVSAGPAADPVSALGGGATAGSRRANVPDGLILALACVAQFMVVLDYTQA